MDKWVGAVFGQMGRGSVLYLFSTICEEFVELMGQKTKPVIINELHNAKYFSVIVDSTPDLSHVDQFPLYLDLLTKRRCSGTLSRF